MRTALATDAIALGKRPALLVVDASKGFTDPQCPLGASFDAEVEKIAALASFALTQNWPRFYTTVCYQNAEQAQVFRSKVPALSLLTPDSPWVAIDERLPMTAADQLITKTHASGFFDTNLHALLQAANIDSLIVCGFTTSGCVRASAVDALQYDYRTFVITDAVGDRDDQAHEANLYDLQAKYAEVMSLQELQDRV